MPMGRVRAAAPSAPNGPVPWVRMRAIRAVFLANGISLGVFYPFVAVILATRGFSPALIGVVTASSSAAFTLAVPAWGHLADVVLGRRAALVISALTAAAAVLLAGAPIPALAVAACFVGFGLFESGWGPLGDALAVNAVRDHARDYARIRLITSAGFAIASAAVGLLYDRVGYGPSFGLCAASALGLAAAAWRAPDLPRANLSAETGGTSRGGSIAAALRVQPRLRGVLVALLLIHVGVIAGFTYLPLRIVALGGSPSDVALNASLGAFAEIPAMLLAGAIAARVGLRGMVTGSALVYAACFVAWMALDSPLLIVATRLVSGFAFAGLWVGAVLTMTVLLPPRLQATGQGLYQVTGFGVAAIVANLVGGQVYAALGSSALFAGAAVLAVGAAILALAVFPRAGEPAILEGEPAASLPLRAPTLG
jgi:PPP family 3-phenylpropionic acid transporter